MLVLVQVFQRLRLKYVHRTDYNSVLLLANIIKLLISKKCSMLQASTINIVNKFESLEAKINRCALVLFSLEANKM